jgi:NitT/TauT family transport system permease protein
VSAGIVTRVREGRRLYTAAGVLLPLLGIAAAVVLWWLVVAVFVPHGSFLSRFAPEPTVRTLVRLVEHGDLWPHLLASFRRIFIGLAISVLVGFPLGLAVGSIRIFARASSVVFQFIRMVSPLSWTPLAIILFGVGDKPVYFLIAIGGVWPIVLNTAAGVAALDPRWITLARSLGASRMEILRTIVWPGIRPQVLTGVRLTVGLAWIILVPAEMLGVDSGLGYYILNTRDRLAYSELMASILVIGLCGFLLDLGARLILSERRPGAGQRARRAAESPAPVPDTGAESLSSTVAGGMDG